MKIVTYNLRCVWDGDGINAFIHRAGLLYDRVSAEKPDIIAFQEVTLRHLDLLQKLMPEYTFIGHARDEHLTGEGLYTAFKTSEFLLSSSDVFWISTNKYTLGAYYEEKRGCPRICVSTLLFHKKSEKMLRVYNIHLEHSSARIRRLGIEIVLDQIVEDRQKMETEVVLLGDFNACPDESTIEYCRSFAPVKLTDVTENVGTTYHEYGTLEPQLKIDYIFMTGDLAASVVKTEKWTDEHCGVYLSDHYPVSAILSGFSDM